MPPYSSGYPEDPTTNPNLFVAKLNTLSGQKVGPSIVLRVMAGDTIQLGVKAFYKSIGTHTSSTNSEGIISALVQALDGSNISDGTHGVINTSSSLNSSFSPTDYDELKSKDADENLSDKPKVYLNLSRPQAILPPPPHGFASFLRKPKWDTIRRS
jgi:hypothetical protein